MPPVTPIIFQPYQIVGAHQSLAVASVTNVPIPAGANAMFIQSTGQNVRITLDGSNPTTGRGFQIRAGDAPFLLVLMPLGTGGQPSILALQESATATLEVQGVIQAFP